MSRSRRKKPVFGYTTAKSEKFDKQKYNRVFRRISKEKIKKGMTAPIRIKEIKNVWTMSKDGKRYATFFLKKWLRK